MRTQTLEQYYSPNPVMPMATAIGLHALLFVINPTILKRGTGFPELPTMVIKFDEKLPTLPPAEPKPVPKVEKKPEVKKKPPKKAGLAPKAKSKPTPVKAKAKPIPVKRPFVSKIEMPTFVPKDMDERLASSHAPGLAPAAKQRIVQSAIPPRMLKGKTRGILASDVNFKLTDRGSISGARAIAIPIAEERGETAVLPDAATLHSAPRGIKMPGYRFKPGEGAGAELAGKNKTGYHGAIRTSRYEEGGISASGASGGKTIQGNGFEITGTVGNRKILSRQLPEYPRWAEEKGITAMVQVYFTVKPDGTIRSTLRVQRSSGYAELDQLAKEALLQWRFSPVSSDSDKNLSWGLITFRFTLE